MKPQHAYWFQKLIMSSEVVDAKQDAKEILSLHAEQAIDAILHIFNQSAQPKGIFRIVVEFDIDEEVDEDADDQR
jgi:hypothetical protein